MPLLNYSTNIKTYYIDYVLFYFYVSIAVWPLIWGHYLSFAQIGIILSIGFIVETLLQLPTGALADLIGRRKMIIIARLFKLSQVIIILFATNFWGFLLVQLADNIADALFSGSASALIYDGLKEEGQEHNYQKVESRGYLYATLGFIVASTLGGFLFPIHIKLPYLITLIPWTIGFLNSFRFKETQSFKPEKLTIKKYVDINTSGFKHIFRNRRIKYVSFYSIAISFVFMLGVWVLYQKAGNELGLPPQYVGILVSGLYLIRAFSTLMFPKLFQKLGEGNFGIVLPIIQGLSSFLLIFPNFVASVVGLSGRYLADGLRQPFLGQLQNDQIDSKLRATSLSAIALIVSLLMVIAIPIAGIGVDHFGAKKIIVITGLVSILIALPLSITLRKIEKE